MYQKLSKKINEDIEYICKLMFESLKLPIYFLDNNNDIFFQFYYGHVNNPLHQNKKDLFMQLFEGSDSCDFPIIRSTKYLENYFAVNLKIEDIFIGTFISGPSTYSSITAETIDTLISDCVLPLNYKRDLINYFNFIPVLDYRQLVNSSLLLYYSIYNKKLDVTTVMEKNSHSKNVTIKVGNDYKSNISKNRQNTFFHHTSSSEKKLLQYIKEGNKECLIQHLNTPIDGQLGILSKSNPLRSEKNLAICGVALATRAAMEGGLDYESAYTLSDSYIQAIEEISEMRDLLDLSNKIFCDFADRVCEVNKLKYSKVILTCQNYIIKYLYEDISLTMLAQYVDLNPNYLSDLFRKEVGIPISEYIQKERIEEAKRLLSSTKYSLLDIATWLNFHDQSHFTRLFKKFTGVTPKKYRDK